MIHQNIVASSSCSGPVALTMFPLVVMYNETDVECFFAHKGLFDSHVAVTRVGLVHDQRRLWSVVLASSVVPDDFTMATCISKQLLLAARSG